MATVRVISTSSQYTISQDGPSLAVTYLLENVAAAGDEQFIINAGQDAGLPSTGTQHGTLTALTLYEKVARSLDGGFAEVVCSYRPGGLISIHSSKNPPANNSEVAIWNTSFSTESRRVTKDKDAADIIVSAPAGEEPGDGPDSEIVEVDKLVPVGILRAERRELDPPMSRLRTAIGKVNSVSHGSYGARTLLCAGISAQTDNTSPDSAPSSYDGWHVVTYEFAYDADTWDAEVTWSRFDGRQPAAHDANSRKLVKVYSEVNFVTSLSLDFTDPS